MHVNIFIALLSLLFIKGAAGQEVSSYSITSYGGSTVLPSVPTDISLLVNVTNPFVLHLAGSRCTPNVKVNVGNERLELFCKAPLGNQYFIIDPAQPTLLKISTLREATTATVWPYFHLINQNWETTRDAVDSRMYPTGYIASHRNLTKHFEIGLDSQFTLGSLEGVGKVTIDFIMFKIGTSTTCDTSSSLANVNKFRIINGTTNGRLYTCGNVNQPPANHVVSTDYLSTLRFRFSTNSNRNKGFLIKYTVKFHLTTTTTTTPDLTSKFSQKEQSTRTPTVSGEVYTTGDVASQKLVAVVSGALSGSVALLVILVVIVFMMKRQRMRSSTNSNSSRSDQLQTAGHQNEDISNESNEDDVDEDPYCTPATPTDSSHQYSVLNLRETRENQISDHRHEYANVEVNRESVQYVNVG